MNKEILDYIKILSDNDRKSLSQKVLKLFEEGGELAKKTLPFDNASGTKHRFTSKKELLEEVADVILVALSIGFDLGMTQDELSNFMKLKSDYWAVLQNNETKLKEKIPYEIHISINGMDGSVDELTYDTFRDNCIDLKVKSVVLELFNDFNEHVKYDYMTSSIFLGNNKTVLEECERIEKGLIAFGYDTTRVKIETVPWHPMAPSSKGHNFKMPVNCYFEHHINIIFDANNINMKNTLLKDLQDWWVEICSGNYGLKIRTSENLLKKNDQGFIYSITLRDEKNTSDFFKDDVSMIRNYLVEEGFTLEEDENIEFIIYDTNKSLDNEWMK